MATVSALIEETRRLLFGGLREERNKLAVSILSSTTGLVLTYPAGQIARGAKLSIELEDIYVWGINPSDPLHVTPIDRGQWGSAAAGHTSGAIIHVNPKFSNWEIFNAINDEINALSSPAVGLFRVATEELTYSSAVTGYAYAPANLIAVHEVRYQMYGPDNEYPLSTDWEFATNLSDEFAGGSAIYVRDALPGRTVLVTGKFKFTPLSASVVADTADTGIPDSAVDILTLGAAWRLSSALEVGRNFTTSQGDTRRSQEVPPGAALGGARELGRMRALRIQEEVSRLHALYPPRQSRYPYLANYG